MSSKYKGGAVDYRRRTAGSSHQAARRHVGSPARQSNSPSSSSSQFLAALEEQRLRHAASSEVLGPASPAAAGAGASVGSAVLPPSRSAASTPPTPTAPRGYYYDRESNRMFKIGRGAPPEFVSAVRARDAALSRGKRYLCPERGAVGMCRRLLQRQQGTWHPSAVGHAFESGSYRAAVRRLDTHGPHTKVVTTPAHQLTGLCDICGAQDTLLAADGDGRVAVFDIPGLLTASVTSLAVLSDRASPVGSVHCCETNSMCSMARIGGPGQGSTVTVFDVSRLLDRDLPSSASVPMPLTLGAWGTRTGGRSTPPMSVLALPAPHACAWTSSWLSDGTRFTCGVSAGGESGVYQVCDDGSLRSVAGMHAGTSDVLVMVGSGAHAPASVLLGARNGTVMAWDTREHPRLSLEAQVGPGSRRVHRAPTSIVCIHPVGWPYIAIGDAGSRLQLFDERMWRAPVGSFTGYSNSHHRLGVSVDGSHSFIAAACNDGCVRVWDAASTRLLYESEEMEGCLAAKFVPSTCVAGGSSIGAHHTGRPWPTLLCVYADGLAIVERHEHEP